MKKIGIFCLGSRRVDFTIAHAYELSKCKYDNFHFHLLANNIHKTTLDTIQQLLGNRISVHFFHPTELNYINKVNFAISQNYDFSIKHDEDCFMKAESWDKLFSNTENMSNDDLLCTGAISSGIPTVEMFLEHHTPEIKDEVYEMFKNIKLGHHGVDYTPLNCDYETWNPDIFYERVSNFYHYYKGIHPIRIDLISLKKINDYILGNFDTVMSLKDKPIIKDNSKYPYFCNNVFGIRTSDWEKIVSNRELYVDNFDEVPLNRYRNMTAKNFVFDTGIPIIHTMYNWTPDWQYENNFISEIFARIGKQ